MQEQAPYKITPEQGWSQMKSLLDREMPVEKRSRRMIAFWWSLAGVALMGLVGAYALRSDFISAKSNSIPPAQQVTPKETVPNESNQSEQKTTSGSREYTMNTPDQKSAILSAERTNTSSSAQKERKITSTPKAKHQNAIVEKDASATSISASQTANQNTEFNAIETVAQSGQENTAKEVNEVNSIGIDYPVPAPVYSNAGVAEPVPSLAISYFTIPVNELGPIQASEFTNIEKHGVVIHPGVEASVLSGFNGGTGLYAGAGADVKLTSRFSLTAGLGYRTFHPGANLFSATNADLAGAPSNNELVKNDTTFNGFYVPGEAINNATYQDLDPVIESLHQWQAQAGVDWRFSRRFSLEGGLGLAFLTKAYSEYPIVPFSYATANSNTKISNSLDGYDVIRKTMASCFAGVSYHIGRHIAVKLQWLHTFQPYLATNGNAGAYVSSQKRDDYIRGITLGMKYSFL